MTNSILIGTAVRMSLRYVYLRNGIYYYQRKVPRDLLDRYGGVNHIKENLNTSDPKVAAKKVEALNHRLQQEWKAMRDDSDLTPSQARAGGEALLRQYGLEPYPKENPEHLLDGFYDAFERKRMAHARGNEDRYDAPLSDYLTPSEVAAVKLLQEAPQFLLSDALPLYLSEHSKGSDQKFKQDAENAWNTLISAVGDKPFMEVSREDARAWRDFRLNGGSKTNTVDRNLSTIRAVFNVVIREKELDKTNPFENLKIPNLGEDRAARSSFTMEQLDTIKVVIMAADDDVRWLLGLQVDLGCRIAEAVGLALTDIHLDAPIPYVEFKTHPWRSLKTKNSKRKVPLVGLSLWAAQRVVASASPNQKFCFPRYVKDTGSKATHASNTLNKWMELKLGTKKTTHELRHTMRDRLRNVNAPKAVQDAIGGWAKDSIGEGYGEGYSLEVLKGWMDKIAMEVTRQGH